MMICSVLGNDPEEELQMDTRDRDPCRDHSCRRGKCQAAPGAELGYSCACRPGYTGTFCEKKNKQSRFNKHSYSLLLLL